MKYTSLEINCGPKTKWKQEQIFKQKRRFQHFVVRLKPFVASLFRRADDGNRNTRSL